MSLEILIANNAESVLTADITAAATSLTIRSADASKFPNPTLSSQGFYATLERKNTGEVEIILVTARASNVFTVTRAQDGTTALTFVAGDLVGVRTNKATIDAYLVQQAALLPQKNAIIGGDFGTNPWQDGTSFVSPATATYVADNVRLDYVTSGTVSVSKSADGPTVAQADRLITHCLLIDCTGADAAVAAGDFMVAAMFIEGYDWIPYAQRALALRFWHKHTKVGTYCVALRNSANDRSLVMEYTQAVTDTWEEAILDLAASPSAGTWDYTSGLGLSAAFTVMGGSTFQTTASAWQTGNFVATANQVNGLDNAVNNFRIANVRLGAGSASSARFTTRTEAEEVTLQRRCYERWDHGGGSNHLFVGGGRIGGSTTDARIYIRPSTRKRTVPTLVSSSAAAFLVQDGASNLAVSALAITATQDTVEIAVTCAAGTVAHAVNLVNTNVGSYVAFSARF